MDKTRKIQKIKIESFEIRIVWYIYKRMHACETESERVEATMEICAFGDVRRMYHRLHEQCKLQNFARGQIIHFNFWLSHFECGFCGEEEFIVIE